MIHTESLIAPTDFGADATTMHFGECKVNYNLSLCSLLIKE